MNMRDAILLPKIRKHLDELYSDRIKRRKNIKWLRAHGIAATGSISSQNQCLRLIGKYEDVLKDFQT